jgi:hypothetical protein
MIKNNLLLLILVLFFITPLLHAQSNEQNFTRRIVWRGGEHALRYAVEIDRFVNGRFRSHLREFTTSLFFDVTLPHGEYRFRIIPHDILDRPVEGTQWMHFEIRHIPSREITDASPTGDSSGGHVGVPNEDTSAVTSEQFQIITFDNQASSVAPASEPAPSVLSERQPVVNEAVPESERSARFNTLGISAGSSFIDPLIITTLHGTFSPIQNLFIELGFDIGFVSIFEDVESFYCLYPFAHIGFFMPFATGAGFFVGVGGGYMIGNYIFSYGTVVLNFFGFNVTAGVNLFNAFNISYTFRTSFSAVNHKLALGYVYRFR